MDARVHIFTAMALGGGRMASPTLGRLYPGEIPRYSFYRRLSGPQDQSGHEEEKKNLHTSDTQDRTRTVQLVAKAMSLEVPGPIFNKFIITFTTFFIYICFVIYIILFMSLL